MFAQADLYTSLDICIIMKFALIHESDDAFRVFTG